MARFSSRTTSVRFEGLNGNGMTIGPGPGDFTFGQTNKENTEKLRVMDRAQFDGHINGEDLEQEWSLTVGLRNQSLASAVSARVTDFVEQDGIFHPTTGTSPTQTISTCPDIWAWKGIVTMVLGATTATWNIPLIVGGYNFSEAVEGNTIALSGTNNGKITRT